MGGRTFPEGGLHVNSQNALPYPANMLLLLFILPVVRSLESLKCLECLESMESLESQHPSQGSEKVRYIQWKGRRWWKVEYSKREGPRAL